jgi:hypothetical protein
LTESPAAQAFTEDLVQVIRQQRHLATRVIIATQEPTISPKLLDLCNVAIVHQFQSPAWYNVLTSHLAALAPRKQKKKICKNENRDDSDSEDEVDIRNMIVNLRNGQALVFCPKAVFDVKANEVGKHEFMLLQSGFAKIKVRGKVTGDGGRSLVATSNSK